MLLNPEFPWIHEGMALTYMHQGNPERALVEIDNFSVGRNILSIKSNVLLALGKELESRAIANEFLETSAQEYPMVMAIIYAWRGDNDSAFAWLEEAFVQRTRELNNILWNDALSRLENDPRYPGFLEKLGLLEAWKAMPPEKDGVP